MKYTEKELLEAKKRSFNEGMSHAKPSTGTLRMFELQKEYIKEVMDQHEKREMENYDRLKDMFEAHIKETATLNETFKTLISGGIVIRWLFTGLVVVVSGLGVIIGGVYAVKEWIKR